MAEPLDRDAVERVLRRATELSPDEHDEPVLDEVSLVEAAGAAGIPAAAVRRSLAIERLGPAQQSRVLDRLVGPALVQVERAVELAPDVVLDRLAAWLTSRHYLREERSRPGEMTWSKREGLAARALRSTRTITGEGQLGDVRLLRAQAVAIDGSTSLVRVSIDRSRSRRNRLATGSVIGAGGVVALSGVAIAAPIVLVGAPVAAAAVGVAHSGSRQAGLLEREVLRLLDSVESGRSPRRLPSLSRGLRRSGSR